MGYRSTFTTYDRGGTLPDWFVEKYADRTTNPKGTLMVSKGENKLFYDNVFLEDYQKALLEIGYFDKPYESKMVVVVLGESGNVTRVDIYADRILFFDMIHKWSMDGVKNSH